VGQDPAKIKYAQNYLKKIEESSEGLLPNFWMSAEYLTLSDVYIYSDPPLAGYKVCSSAPEWFLPPLFKSEAYDFQKHNSKDIHIYAGFPSIISPDSLGPNRFCEFLDYQFIYDPENFITMKGKRWKVFRRNVHKFLREYPALTYKKIEPGEYIDKISRLLQHWSEGALLFDHEVMVRFLFFGKKRWGLFSGNVLIGINVYDENWKYINYRYCIDNKRKFVNKILRYFFYTHPEILDKNKLVNDGGCLDRPGLFQFKSRLNPVEIYSVFSS
jgi:hypothetical protein